VMAGRAAASLLLSSVPRNVRMANESMSRLPAAAIGC
jgi:hypothetical protein